MPLRVAFVHADRTVQLDPQITSCAMLASTALLSACRCHLGTVRRVSSVHWAPKCHNRVTISPVTHVRKEVTVRKVAIALSYVHLAHFQIQQETKMSTIVHLAHRAAIVKGMEILNQLLSAMLDIIAQGVKMSPILQVSNVQLVIFVQKAPASNDRVHQGTIKMKWV